MSTPEVEMRSTPRPVAVRGNTLEGYGAVYNSRSRDLGGFQEVMSASFFNKSQGDGYPDCVCNLEHRPEQLLGTTRARTLEFRSDATGLFYTVILPDTSAGRDTRALVDRGDIIGSSVAFNTYQDDWQLESGVTVRHLVSGRLLAVSPTASPAYSATSASLRSLAIQVDGDPEEILALARQGQLPKLVQRTDNRGPAPTPLEVAQRSIDPELDRRMRSNFHRAMDANRDARLDLYRRRDANSHRQETMELEERMMLNQRRSMQWDAPAESPLWSGAPAPR
ncbi:MAG TPA: HK97 family phage prohead protease [Mycobacterium sp.]|nr:HK97 family phage prohead protease [Mycobacterium sp.]HTX94339.1 HK97 family phage prohead protease [Mycobacterium sp.]